MFYHLHWLFLIAAFVCECAAQYKIEEVEVGHNRGMVTKYRKYKNWQSLSHMSHHYDGYKQYQEPCGTIVSRKLLALAFLAIWIAAAFITWIVWLFQNLSK
jgi:hypothetical protein